MQLKFHCHVFADSVVILTQIVAVEVKIQQKVINLEIILSPNSVSTNSIVGYNYGVWDFEGYQNEIYPPWLGGLMSIDGGALGREGGIMR
jgi:hypothetical protein